MAATGIITGHRNRHARMRCDSLAERVPNTRPQHSQVRMIRHMPMVLPQVAGGDGALTAGPPLPRGSPART